MLAFLRIVKVPWWISSCCFFKLCMLGLILWGFNGINRPLLFLNSLEVSCIHLVFKAYFF